MSTAEIEGTLLDPAVQACPFGYHQQLREKAPVYRMPETGFYVISNYEDLKTVLSDPVTFSNDIEIEQLAGEAAADLGRMFDDHLAEVGWGHVQTLQRTDPPVHGRYRRLINRTLTPPMVKGMLPSVTRIADDLIDAFIDKGECDFIEAFAFPLPGLVIAEQIGLDAAQINTFKAWSDGMLAPAMGLLVDEASAKKYAEVEAEAQHYLAKLFEERRANPTDDILSALLADSTDGDEPLTMHELQNLMNQLITGGYTTTADSIGNAMLLLLENPDQMELLRNDRSLLHNFADEALRHSSSVQGLFRRTTVDTELSGVTIPANSIVHTRYGSANWDENVFPEPEKFDITRDNANKHLAFSRGPHFCVGQPLAIQELMIGFDRILDRLDNIQLAPGANLQRTGGLIFYSLVDLPITFTARA
ncbi:MAG: cytochrome P450 [Candidatus Nanopelagicales bacterium]